MSSRESKPPTYRKQIGKTGARAFVELGERRVYLGPYNSKESRERYTRALAEWESSGGHMAVPANQLTIVELVARFCTFCEGYYVKADGRVTAEVGSVRTAMRPLLSLYARTLATDFGPRALKAVRDRMIGMDWSRKYTNKHVDRIKRMYKWAVAEELVPNDAYHGLQAVSGLRRGRSKARDTAPIQPVPDAYINAVQPHVARQVWSMVELQRLTAARPGEIVRLRPIDLDTSGKVWLYTLEDRKTAHHGHKRTIYLGPLAQRIVEPFLRNRPVEAFLFSPRDAIRDRASEAKNHRREGQKPSPRQTDRVVEERYTVGSYRRAIHRACKVAKVPQWCPLQLRHNAATFVRKEFGLEAAQLICGHAACDVTQVYAEVNRERALEIAAKVG